MIRLALLMALLCLMAGCTSHSVNPELTSTASASGSQTMTSSVQTQTSTTAPVETPSFQDLAGVDCIEGLANTISVAGRYGETPPPGWEQRPGEIPTTSITEQILRCGRIEWGSFERPAHFLWETHQSFSTPDSCRKDGALHYFLGTVWSDDPDLVAQAARLGMPAILGNFSLAEMSNQGIDLRTWSWSAVGGQPSNLSFTSNPPDVAVTFTSPSRFFWFTGNQVNYYDNTFVEDRNQVDEPATVGTMAEPMLYAKGGVADFVGSATWARKASFSGTIHRFSDLECKNELPPP